ncbi:MULTISPECIES: carbonic anhydrase [Paenibacillus]|jgi:carbonic anhydrase|uniref:carbonic anhydrase n=1 Tax=Paenibacillus odorifer TaxID=189426 RepID=A0A1R0WSP7_9BACL|nr:MULTISPECIES: carbonic anhydrase [Paenibacillus]AIQ75121.1 carbonic anhydrase [Paenibacillus odorifer]AWV34437.1 carbonic anhydrase [Paenibacillus odorifer]ETT45989.1 carbonic anhydrase [Paenibacillus sp. FSL H8-237]MDH6428094.1 carbonic anhydrase [Paenibacillus sp. PastH-4]MDH6444274.1 carbonic anhydrase [Paenibacillus sp. PastF-4]
MSHVSEIINFNKSFVENKDYEAYLTSRYPDKKMLIITCMDTRLVELLPKAMNFKNGDVKIIKNAGAVISQPFGSVMRSVMVALYELDAEEVIVVGHYECGMASLNADHMINSIKERGVSEEVLSTLENSGIKLTKWLRGFDNVEEGVIQTVDLIKRHPLLPPNVPIHGMIIDPATGALELVADGYK